MMSPLAATVIALALLVTASAASAQSVSSTSTGPTPSAPVGSPVLGMETPWRGGSIPPGYRLHTTPNTGVVAGGIALFVGGWLPALIVAGSNEREWAMALPVVGPFIAAGDALGSSSGDSFSGLRSLVAAAAVADGFLQAGGIAMTVAGIMSGPRVMRYEPELARSAAQGSRWAVAPGTSGAPLGLTLSLTSM